MSKAILKLIIPPSTYSLRIPHTSGNYLSISYKILHLHAEIVYKFFTLVFLFYFLLTLSKAIIEFTIPWVCVVSMSHTHQVITKNKNENKIKNKNKKTKNKKQKQKQEGILARIFELQSSWII